MDIMTIVFYVVLLEIVVYTVVVPCCIALHFTPDEAQLALNSDRDLDTYAKKYLAHAINEAHILCVGMFCLFWLICS